MIFEPSKICFHVIYISVWSYAPHVIRLLEKIHVLSIEVLLMLIEVSKPSLRYWDYLLHMQSDQTLRGVSWRWRIVFNIFVTLGVSAHFSYLYFGVQMTIRSSSVLQIFACVDTTYEPPRDKTNKMVRPAKTQFGLGIRRPIWSVSSLSSWRKLGSLATHKTQAKTLIRLGGSESSLGAQSLCSFCHVVAHLWWLNIHIFSQQNSCLQFSFWQLAQNNNRICLQTH